MDRNLREISGNLNIRPSISPLVSFAAVLWVAGRSIGSTATLKMVG